MSHCSQCKCTLKTVYYHGEQGLYCSASCFEKGEAKEATYLDAQLEIFSNDECRCTECTRPQKPPEQLSGC